MIKSVKKTHLKKSFLLLFAVAAAMGIGSCSKTKSYSELLREEERATNWFLSNQRVETQIPEDSIFESGENAPYYKMDKDGYIYMQVINPGNRSDSIKTGDLVYFRFKRKNIETMYSGGNPPWVGNSESMDPTLSVTSFVFGNRTSASASEFGSGIQVPLNYLGNHSEVNLVLRSYYGFSTDMSECVPYLINLRYFKAEY